MKTISINLLLLCICTSGWAQIKIDKVLKDKKDKLKENMEPKTSVPDNTNISKPDVSVGSSAFDGTANTVVTLAGSGFSYGTYNANGYKDGKGKEALFDKPSGITVDEDGNLYIADRQNYCIRKIAPDGQVSTLAGTNEQDSKNGMGKDARFFDPSSIWYDGKKFFYVTEIENHAVRKISKEGKVTTIVFGKRNPGYADGPIGTAEFSRPVAAVTNSKGDILVLDQGNHCIRKISGTEVSTFVGSPRNGYKDDKGQMARFDTPTGMVIDANDNIYVIEQSYHRIRKVTPDGTVSTLADFTNINAGDRHIHAYNISVFTSIALGKKGNFYITDEGGRAVHEVSADGKEIKYLLTGSNCDYNDSRKSDAIHAKLSHSHDAVDGKDCEDVVVSRDIPGICETPKGELFFIDKEFCCIRQLVRK